MISFPDCGFAQTELLLTMRDDRQDDRLVTMTKYICQSYGCEFETRERWEVETEVTEHGREYET
jgi:hypothetical protein